MTNPPNSPAVAVADLVVNRGDRTVLNHLTFTIEAGAVTGLLGPSGCGKSTLMRSIVGAQIVRSGTVTVLGKPAGTAALRHRVGYMTQAYSVYDDLSVKDNVTYFASLYGVGRAGVREAIGNVGLADHSDQLVGNLSGGQRTRTSLACALISAPELLVLDEPTVGLDPVIRADLWGQFHALADNGVTLIVSSHVMDEAQHCRRLLLLREGVLVADDTPQALLTATGAADLEGAFLTLIRSQEA